MADTMNRGDAFLEMLIRDNEVAAEKALEEIDYIKRLFRQFLEVRRMKGQKLAHPSAGLRAQFEWERRNLCDARCEILRLKGFRKC